MRIVSDCVRYAPPLAKLPYRPNALFPTTAVIIFVGGCSCQF